MTYMPSERSMRIWEELKDHYNDPKLLLEDIRQYLPDERFEQMMDEFAEVCGLGKEEGEE